MANRRWRTSPELEPIQMVQLMSTPLMTFEPYSGPCANPRSADSLVRKNWSPYVPFTLGTGPASNPVDDLEETPQTEAIASIDEFLSDDWPFEDAAAATAQLSDLMGPPRSKDFSTGESLAVGLNADQLLPMWSDDEPLDIMPAPTKSLTISDIAVVFESAPATSPSSAETAARILEVLAQRVRDGELSIPENAVALGEAAALAATLALLLQARG